MGSHNKEYATSLTMGAIFIVLGLLEIVSTWFHEDWMNYLSTGNLALGLVMLVTGAVFLMASKEFSGDRDGEAFLIVACGLALFVGLVALLSLIGDASEAYLLNNEDFADWSPVDDFTPAILMMVPSLVILWYQLKNFWAGGSPAPVMEGKP